MRTSLTLIVLLMVWHLAAQYPRHLQFDPVDTTADHQIIDLGGGALMIAAETRFSNDSTSWDLYFCDTSYHITARRNFRFSIKRSFLRDAIEMAGHRILCGVAEAQGGQRYPLLLNTAGNSVIYSAFFSNLLFDQNELVGVQKVSDSTFVSYTTSTGLEEIFYRIETHSDTLISNVQSISANSDIKFQLQTTAQGLAQTTHWVGGTAAFNTEPNNRQVIIAPIVPTGILWSRMYDMGAEGTEVEEMRSITPLADGSTIVVVNYSDSLGNLRSAVMKLGPVGVPIWCTRLFIEQDDLQLSASYQLPDNSLLVAGGSGDGNGMFIVLNDTGTMRSQHVFTGGSGVNFTSVTRPAQDLITLSADQHILQLRHDLGGCEVHSSYSVVAEPYNVIMTTALLDNDPYVTLASGLLASPIVSSTELIEQCFFTSVEEVAEQHGPLGAYPNPTEGPLSFTGINVRPGEPAEVLDLQGSVVLSTNYGSRLDLSPLVPGAYLVRLPERSIKPLIVVKQ